MPPRNAPFPSWLLAAQVEPQSGHRGARGLVAGVSWIARRDGPHVPWCSRVEVLIPAPQWRDQKVGEIHRLRRHVQQIEDSLVIAGFSLETDPHVPI